MTSVAVCSSRYLDILVSLQRSDSRVRELDVVQRPVGAVFVVFSTGEPIVVLLLERSHRWLFSLAAIKAAFLSQPSAQHCLIRHSVGGTLPTLYFYLYNIWNYHILIMTFFFILVKVLIYVFVQIITICNITVKKYARFYVKGASCRI